MEFAMILKLQDLVNEYRWVVLILNMTLKIFFYVYFAYCTAILID